MISGMPDIYLSSLTSRMNSMMNDTNKCPFKVEKMVVKDLYGIYNFDRCLSV